MRDHGFDFKAPDEVSLDDWIVTEFRPLGEAEHVRTVARAFKVGAMAASMGQYGWVYTFQLDGGDHSYQVPATAMVPVTIGPSVGDLDPQWEDG